MAPAWILIASLKSLFAEFDALAPRRARASDGSIGDLAHQREVSDHNPDETGAVPTHDADKTNEVHAIDVSSDLRQPGWSMQRAVDIIVGRHRSGKDDRLQYVIYARTIWSRSWGWTAHAYTGPSAHYEHAHFSSRYGTAQERDTRPWGLLDEEDDMATISQDDFNARMDAWWNSRMSPTAKDNPARSALRVAPWQQEVGRSGETTHNMLFGEMKDLLAKAAAEDDSGPAAA